MEKRRGIPVGGKNLAKRYEKGPLGLELGVVWTLMWPGRNKVTVIRAACILFPVPGRPMGLLTVWEVVLEVGGSWGLGWAQEEGSSCFIFA